jgi:hypothetical protein
MSSTNPLLLIIFARKKNYRSTDCFFHCYHFKKKRPCGMLLEGSKHVSFVQFLADALLTSDIYICLASKKKKGNYFYIIGFRTEK